MSKKSIRIDLVSDVVCPWCIIGYKRLEKALALIADRVEADIHRHPFELNPQMPDGGENLRAHLSDKYGTTLDQSIKARANLTAMGADLGFQFDYYDEMKMFNTFKAHQLLHYARTQGLEHELHLRLFSAFFGERKAIDQIDVLIAEAEAVGLNGSDARAALESAAFADAVREEQAQWTNLGITAVPTFVVDQKLAVSGAQEPAALAAVILEQV